MMMCFELGGCHHVVLASRQRLRLRRFVYNHQRPHRLMRLMMYGRSGQGQVCVGGGSGLVAENGRQVL